MSKKRGLGKGLEALIPPTADQWDWPEAEAAPGLAEVPVEAIDPNPHQPRARIQETELTELVASIADHGVIQPVIVTRAGDRYQLIAGERRWRAARLAGLATVPVIVKEASSQEMLELALVENIQRADLNPLEEATAYRQLIDGFGLTQAEVAALVGRSRPAVANTVRLLELPEKARQALQEVTISEGHGGALLALPTAESRLAALANVLKRHLSVRQTEEYVRRLLGEQPAAQPHRLAPEIESVRERLRQRLGTKVDISYGKKGGRIAIHYFSGEELQAILDQIEKE